MRLKIIFLILTVLSVSVRLCSAQADNSSKAVLFDKFLKQPYGATIARIDNFVVHLAYNPNSDGYVVIYPEKNSLKPDFRRGKRLKEIIINRFYQVSGFDEKRFQIVRGEERNELKIELWEVPRGAQKPFSILEILPEKPRDLSKAFIFGSEDIEEAYANFAPRRFAKILSENPNLRGHIVIFNKSKKESRLEMQCWLSLFSEDYKLPRSRLKFFFAKNNGRPDAEFWIVPKK
jgi:hypothetical protein